MVDDPSSQLHLDLHNAVARSLQDRRPLLHHLNADSSWLLQLPRPRRSKSSGNGRTFYNILIDPWLKGGQSDVASWFSQQWHATESKVQTIAELEELIQRVEDLAHESQRTQSETRVSNESASSIDVVAISHEFTDHCHKDTLLEVSPDVPVFANDRAVPLIQSWKHFRNTIPIPAFTPSPTTDWRTTSLSPLPDWLSITRLINPSDALYYHAALLITFHDPFLPTDSPLSTPTDPTAGEAVIYTPHGISAPAIPDLTSLSPPIRTLALLHGLHAVNLSAQKLNLGAHNGLAAQRKLRARYWIGTHDEVKRGGGLVSWFLDRQAMTLEEALEKEKVKETMSEGERADWDAMEFMEVRNGESVALR